MSGRLKKTIGVLIAGLALLLAFVGYGRLSQSQQLAPVVKDSVEQLRPDLKTTQVPLALPTKVPKGIKTFYTSVIGVQADRYDLSLDGVQDCYGVASCNVGEVSGEVIGTQSIDEEFGVPNDPNLKPLAKSSIPAQDVQLANGISGRFIPYVCGASCSNSKVVWDSKGYRYLVGIKGDYFKDDQELKQLVEMANSAILNQR